MTWINLRRTPEKPSWLFSTCHLANYKLQPLRSVFVRIFRATFSVASQKFKTLYYVCGTMFNGIRTWHSLRWTKNQYGAVHNKGISQHRCLENQIQCDSLQLVSYRLSFIHFIKTDRKHSARCSFVALLVIRMHKTIWLGKNYLTNEKF